MVFCNCDDPTWSAFWRYFHLNFAHLGLKKLISTHYDKEKPTYKMVYEGGNDNEVETGARTPLEGNGDFRNQECIELLKEADIVVTNPPFSIARESYLPQLFEYDKKFLIIGDLNWVTYKLIFPLLKENRMWMGYSNVKEFLQPDGKIKRFGNKLWFTNLDIKKRHDKLILWKKYTPAEFPTYDNYNAINVDKVSNIPCNYCESWCVTEEEFKNFPANEWEITRKEEKDGKDYFFIIPAEGTELRKMLHEHSAGYREEIEKSIWKNMQKKIIYTENNTPARQETCKTGMPEEYFVQQNLYPEDIVTESSAYQSPSLANTARNNLKSLDMSMMSTGTEGMELTEGSLKQGGVENINESSSERYCNGVEGVPITFLDKYNPEQFRIIWQASGNTRACCPETILQSLNYTTHKDDRGGCGVVNGKRVYSRILVQKKL